ncbi:MAG: hypothetical protein LBH43_12960 [Treponema sp.]|jgi:hypothetical protein|nr:hypothetical protein [Treponema sp.]
MTEWIGKNLDPPGMERKNWRSIFAFIGSVFGVVKDDAIKAHNAFFPYLCDEDKLKEHGDALAIPHLMYDTPEEYRDRVSTASFFLMKAGERGFIMGLLEERFGDRFQVVEKFLQLQTKISELTYEEKTWTLSLLDFLIDPVVSLEISEWFRFTERSPIRDLNQALYALKYQDTDSFKASVFHNSQHRRNGEINHDPGGGIKDKFETGLKLSMTDNAEIADESTIGIRRHHFHNGKYKRDGSIRHDGMVLVNLD